MIETVSVEIYVPGERELEETIVCIRVDRQQIEMSVRGARRLAKIFEDLGLMLVAYDDG